jgi:hypothetical protein
MKKPKYTRKQIIWALEQAMAEHGFTNIMKDMFIASLDYYLEKEDDKRRDD